MGTRTWMIVVALAAWGCSPNPQVNPDGGFDAGVDAGPCTPWSGPIPDRTTGCPSGGPTDAGRPSMTSDAGSGVTVFTNLTYGVRGGRVLQGDLYVPAGGAQRPGVLVVVHGGGWADCSRRRDAVAWYAQAIAQLLRVATFNVEYRLTEEGGGYPENLGDIKCAVQWMAANASTYNLDGARIAVTGESAGAHLALMVGVTQDRADLDPACSGSPPLVKATISYSAPIDLPRLNDGGSLARGAPDYYAGPCGGPVENTCDRGRSCTRCGDASPLAHACAGKGMFVIIQAPDAFDQLIPEQQAHLLADAMSDAGVSAQLVVPTPAQLQANGCQPNTYALQAHGLINTCLTTPSGGVVSNVLAATIGP